MDARLLRTDARHHEPDNEKSDPRDTGWFIEDVVENTIAKAQTFDFDKQRDQMQRHIHYTAATSPTGMGSGPPKDSWYMSGGTPLADEAEARIVEGQHRAEKAGLSTDFEKGVPLVPPVVVKKTSASAAIPQNFPKECFKPRHSTTIGEDEACPEACPLFAEDTTAETHCVFKCVTKTDCGAQTSATNLARSVPDTDAGFCRRCSVPGCNLCNRTAHSDTCQKCLRGFALQEGACVFQVPIVGTLLQSLVYVALFIPMAYFVVWYVSLATRKKVNLEEEAQALQFRTQTKLCAVETVSGEAPAEERQLWPLKTNTLSVPRSASRANS